MNYSTDQFFKEEHRVLRTHLRKFIPLNVQNTLTGLVDSRVWMNTWLEIITIASEELKDDVKSI